MKGNRNKEYILNVYLMLNKSNLEQQLRRRLKHIDIEKKIADRKIDVVAQTAEGINVYGEIQLNTADAGHLAQILKIVKLIPDKQDCMIIWIATEFSDHTLEVVVKAIEKSSKNIEFVAVTLKEGTLAWLEYLNSIDTLEVMRQIEVLDTVEHMLSIRFRYYKYQGYEKIQNENIIVKEMDDKQVLLEKVIREARIYLKDYLPLYRNKRVVDNRVSIGTGISDVIYHIGVGRDNYFYVEIKFSGSRYVLYRQLLQEREEINRKLDYRNEWEEKNLRIITKGMVGKNQDRQAKEIVIVLGKYIDTFYRLMNK